MNEKILEKKLLRMVEEDVGFYDITTAFTPKKKVEAEITARDSGVVSGIYELQVLFNLFNIKSTSGLKDGGEIKRNQRIFSLRGNSRDILLVERTALNILSRMSGISSLTREFVNKAGKINPEIKIAATRKTTPLFGYFEKKAVKVAGGDTHRLGLGDEVLIKDNHLKLFGGVDEALRVAKRETSFTHKIEIEVNTLSDAVLAAKSGVDVVMLDNMSVGEVRKVVSALEEINLRGDVILEASGGITPRNISDYAKSDVDVVSIGALTHSAPALDFSLEIL
ncbi:MAG: carboxylating nicotinate-nucleotide diphosphorylase [Candidatus Altiarchaeota archaeon]|nr:carboxylating nicotinate-nucleotide diphosphorylase [Candidatus Altiarchaeota archaeon]